MEIYSNNQHPNPQPNPHHRRIELQSPLDLTYLQSNLTASANRKLALHFPPSTTRRPATFISLDGGPDASSHQIQPEDEADDDPMLTRVQSLISAFLQRTWTAAAHNISINGLYASSLPDAPSTQPLEKQIGEREGVDFTYAAYDSRLQTQVASLYGELEGLTAQVSRLRREAPRTGAERYVEVLRERLRGEEEEFEREMALLRDSQSSQAKGDVLKLEKQREGYYEDMQVTYVHGVEDLARLTGVGSGKEGVAVDQGGSLTETVGKVQRARTVAMEFE